MAVDRTRALHRTAEPHPAAGLLDAAAPTQPTQTPTQPPALAPEPAPQQVAVPVAAPAPSSERGKKQVNYRLDAGLIDDLKRASIVHSFRQGEQYSQNRIVELAVREWLLANGPWDR